MSTPRRLMYVAALVAAWPLGLGLLWGWLSPVIGAATVSQMAPSNASFAMSMTVMWAAALAAGALGCLSIWLVYRLLSQTKNQTKKQGEIQS